MRTGKTCRFLPALLVVTAAVFTTACATLDYYSQSVSGQLEVMERRQSIAGLVEDPATAPELKHKLETVTEIRRFASSVLALPDNDSYTLYADIQRPFVVWNVFAAHELSLKLKTWCYPFAGCVAYRGYFSEADAKNFANGLREQGYDVYYGGVTAYSTLGWFNDPVLNTVIDFSEARLAGLIFHELAHQQLYVAGDTAFNESFATAVELAGVDAWLAQRGDAVASREYHRLHKHQTAFYQLVAHTREQLLAVYATDISDVDKRREKQRLITELRADYAGVKQGWDGDDRFDAWFAGAINNAQLAATAAYREYLPAFQLLLQQAGGNFSTFYAVVAELAELPAGERAARLQQISSTIDVVMNISWLIPRRDHEFRNDTDCLCTGSDVIADRG